MPLHRFAGALLLLAGAAPLLGQAPPLFRPHELYPLDGWAEAVAVGDVNSDGRNDIALVTGDLSGAQEDKRRLYIYLQRPDGRLQPPVSYPGTGGVSVAIGDVDSDGRNDVVVGGVGVFLQAANGRLQPVQFHSVGLGSLRVAAADFNGDRRNDVVSIPWGVRFDNVHLLEQGNDGRLLPAQNFMLRHDGFEDLDVGDVTGDGLVDLVVVSGQGTVFQNIAVLPQSAAGRFGTPLYYDTGRPQVYQGVAVGDFNHDGRGDIAVSSSGVLDGGEPAAPHLAVLHGRPGGGFEPPETIPVGAAPGGVAAGDLNLDGRDDLAVLHSSGGVGVLLQSRDGALQPEQIFALPTGTNINPDALTIGDIDSDGLPDLVIANDAHGLVVLRHAGRLAARPCAIDDGEALCLLGGRFEIRTVWVDHHNGGRRGLGHATGRTDQSGTFWFFSPESTELAVKALDGRELNQRFWLFYGALSDVGYRVSVLDTATGDLKAYVNPPGRICGRADTTAFSGLANGVEAASLPSEPRRTAAPVPLPAPASGSCVPAADALCLLDGRLRVEGTWRTTQGAQGKAMALPDTDGSGFFWFFSPDNLELTVKAIDGRGVNGRFWFFYGALSDVEYQLTVTDTVTGTARTYQNQSGNLCGGADIQAL
jgi:hypothetical protein